MKLLGYILIRFSLTPRRALPTLLWIWRASSWRIVLLICLFALPLNAASGYGRTVTVGVFSLFRPNRVEIETRRETIVSFQSGAWATQRVLIEGQRLDVEGLGERLQVRFVEHDQRLLQAIQTDKVSVQESLCVLRVPGRIQRQFFGGVEIIAERGHLLPRILVSEETAVEQVLRSEMAAAQELETLKAQAIVIRSYLRTSGRRHPKEGYDLCDTTHCQFFTDFKEDADRFQQAVVASRGLVLTFLGKPFPALYTAACGGQTLEGFPVGNGSQQLSRYLYRAVVCDFCSNHPLFGWETTIETAELVRALKENDDQDPARTLADLAQSGDDVASRELKQRIRLQVGRCLGWNVIRSNRYSVEAISDHVRIKGRGSGHNMGFCQAGAIQLGRQGKSMTDILNFYFPGCLIAR